MDSDTQPKVDTSKHFKVFVGDLSLEINNKALQEAFAKFGQVSEAKVIRDPITLFSKSYGFVSFPKLEEAERAIRQMNGTRLGQRLIRTNWAKRRPGPKLDKIMTPTPSENTLVYVGRLPTGATKLDLYEKFKQFGTIVDISHFKPMGYAFVKYDQKTSAARAIEEFGGAKFMGQKLRLNWGKFEGGMKTKIDPKGISSADANPLAGIFKPIPGTPGPNGAEIEGFSEPKCD